MVASGAVAISRSCAAAIDFSVGLSIRPPTEASPFTVDRG
jgi:hypothetical protein